MANLESPIDDIATPIITSAGGYNYKFVMSKNILEEYCCPICHFVSRNPHQVTCCGKIYCQDCLRVLKLNDNFECSCCHESLVKRYFKDTKSEKKILNLDICCINEGKGCQWQGVISDIDSHLKQCHYQVVSCPNDCSESICPHELDNHLKDMCPHRLISCTHCHVTDKYRVITGTHVDVCPDMPIPCPNKGCNERLLRKSLTNHQEECPKEIIECPFAFIHCREFFEREMLAAHTCNAIEHHLDLSLTHIISLNSDINVLTSNVVQLNRQIDELKLRPTAVQKLVLKMTGFAAYKNNNRIWYSPGFFSGGYKFCLRVDPSGESSCVSCYICLMPGANDGTLEWPFQGDVTIELLNQVRDKGHRKLTIRYNNLTPVIYSSKVVDKVCGPGYGKYEFISHADLSSFDADENCQYLLEDNLYFRVFVKINSKVKPWLVSSVS